MKIPHWFHVLFVLKFVYSCARNGRPKRGKTEHTLKVTEEYLLRDCEKIVENR